MNSKQKFQRNKNIVYREEDDGAFLFNPETGNLKYMNQSGKKAFLMLSEQKDVKQVINEMLGHFADVERPQIENDLETFLKELQENEFLSPLNSE